MSPRDRGYRSGSRDPQIIREEVLRPSHYLGYDRDEMGRYFLGREAFELAESQFSRAVWLNPYEPAFKIHWAVSLIKLNRLDEACTLLEEVLRNQPDDGFAIVLWRRYWPDKPVPGRDAPDKPPPADGSPT